MYFAAGSKIISLPMVMLLFHLIHLFHLSFLFQYLISGLPQEVSTNCNTQ